MKLTRFLVRAAIVSGALVGSNVHALVVNGSFEDIASLPSTAIGTAGAALGPGEWGVYSSIPGWTALTSTGIELHRTPPAVVGGTPTAADGQVYVELDSHPAPGDAAMAQSLALTPGQYRLTFSYKPRTSTVGDNRLYAYWEPDADLTFGNLLMSLNGPPPTDWTQYSVDFSATGAGYLIFSAGSDGASTEGGFLDNVSVTAVPDGGSTLFALGAGLLGLGGLAKRWRK